MSSLGMNVVMSGDSEVLLRLHEMPDGVHRAILTKINSITQRLRTNIINDKLSGQVLNAVTGALQRSIHNIVTDAPDLIVGEVKSSGDVGRYAKVHEYGWDGTVKAHERIITMVWGKEIEPKTIAVRAFERHVPERSFMRSTLAEQQDRIAGELKQAAIDGAAR